MSNQELTTLLSALGVLVSAVAVLVSAITAKGQGQLTKSIHHEQMMLSQRQLFLEIWPKLENLSVIDLDSIVVPDVIRSVNVLELVALCWEGGMVDSGVIRRSFGSRYLEVYEVICKVPNLKNPNKTGMDLLRDNQAIGKLYDQLRKEAQEHGALVPVGR